MSEDMIVRCCAPTLAGIKTGNLFSCLYDSREALIDDVRRLNLMLAGKGICVVPLRWSEGRALIYMFRPGRLKRDLAVGPANRLLKQAGYDELGTWQCIVKLAQRMQGDSFPHEIGLFLSYPPEDVRGFIENNARNCKLVGCWKVYGDEKRAKRIFEQYKKCTAVYCRRLCEGAALEQLAVAM